MRVRRSLQAAFALVSSAGAAGAQQRPRTPIEQPLATSWPVRRAWTEGEERAFGTFVTAIGRGVAERRCRGLAQCLDDPRVNPLHVQGRRMRFEADCADVAYLLRAYYAWRRELPFVFVNHIRWQRRPEEGRRALDTRPAGLARWDAFRSPWQLLHELGGRVNSNWFRMRPEVEDGDWYPARVARGAIRPGTAYYDPDGHVLVVYEVTPEGDVLLFDGHPGGSITARRMDRTLTPGSFRLGGGFMNWRAPVLRDGVVHRPRNADLADYDGRAQYDRARRVVGGRAVSFDTWVRTSLGGVAVR